MSISLPTQTSPASLPQTQPVPATAPPTPRAYRLAFREDPLYTWAVPIGAMVLTAVSYVAMVVALAIPTGLYLAYSTGLGQWLENGVVIDTGSSAELGLDISNPVIAAVALASLALFIPACAIGARFGGQVSFGRLSSVTGRLRWNLLGRDAAIALALVALGTSVSLAVSALSGTPVQFTWTATSAALLGVALLLVPFQAAAEEYLFRGLPQLVLGSWLKSAWWGIVLPIPLFVLGHGYGTLGLVQVGLFALAAGILVWRTGGLEAAIALHIVNNLSGFVLASVGIADLTATEYSLGDTAIQAVVIAAYTGIVLWLTARKGRAAASVAA